ncbi:HAD family hydrolase [Deinococcus sp. NW-56]|uniref:HAD family hydrolase n=1 Tax=Deinococcus sp. NW-56 TaxID=2080419 RepID=UPI00131A1777|nr:HAD family hydrolase [Deinococcus sp. NW-56]
MTPPSDVRAVLFDFDGTLTDYVTADTAALEALRQLACAHVPQGEFVQCAVNEIMAFHARVEAGESDPLRMDHERLTRTLAAYGVSCTDDHLAHFAAALLRETVSSPGAVELLTALHARGLRLGLLTNAYDGPSQRCRLSACFPDGPFEAVVVAGEVGALKPDPRPFHALLDSMNVKPEEAVYIGDSPSHDVCGAVAVGLRAILIHPHPRLRERALALGAFAAVPDLASLLPA